MARSFFHIASKKNYPMQKYERIEAKWWSKVWQSFMSANQQIVIVFCELIDTQMLTAIGGFAPVNQNTDYHPNEN